jgi:hypothetical protein
MINSTSRARRALLLVLALSLAGAFASGQSKRPVPPPRPAQPTMSPNQGPPLGGGPIGNIDGGGRYIPGKHLWSEADINRLPSCFTHITKLGIHVADFEEAGRIFPEWVPVESTHPTQTLEGTVVPGSPDLDLQSNDWPHVSNEDWPTDHYTHDVTFHVVPDTTYDSRYTNLLGYRTITFPCAAQSARLQDLRSELQALESGGARLSPAEREQRKREVAEWHRLHDVEVSRLIQELRSEKCKPVFTANDKHQDSIEVEWETGLGASNSPASVVPNPLVEDNLRGKSGGFFSAGHSRGQTIWNWPTVGDHVHVVGSWIWDRGHAPASTEIHPARLVAVQRHLPIAVDPCRLASERLSSLKADLAQISSGVPSSKCEPPSEACQHAQQAIARWHHMHDQEVQQLTNQLSSPQCKKRLGIRTDVFASADGGALSNNRSPFSYVLPVHMSERNYEFTIANKLPPPSPTARLTWDVERHDGDTFPGDIRIRELPHSSPPQVKVVIPWRFLHAPDNAILARSISLFWNQPPGVNPAYGARAVKVTLSRVHVDDTHDVGSGEYRVFAEVGGQWLFINELQNASNILEEGLGDTSDKDWPIGRTFLLFLPLGESFRVHSGGWEADGINNVFGNIHDPNSHCEPGGELEDWLNDNVFRFFGVGLNGCNDDPIGEVNTTFVTYRRDSLLDLPPWRGGTTLYGSYREPSHGRVKEDIFPCSDTNPERSYYLSYTALDVPAERFWAQWIGSPRNGNTG